MSLNLVLTKKVHPQKKGERPRELAFEVRQTWTRAIPGAGSRC